MWSSGTRAGALAGVLDDLDAADLEHALVGADADHGRVAQRPLRIGGASRGGRAPRFGPGAGEQGRDAFVADAEDGGVGDAVLEGRGLPDEGRALPGEDQGRVAGAVAADE